LRSQNERHYGAWQGLSKPAVSASLGADVVARVRGGLYHSPPPLLAPPPSPGDRKHADLSPGQIPAAESLFDCMERVSPLWDRVRDDLAAGKNVLLCAHGNSLRGLVKLVDGVRDEDISNVAIPTAIPIVYKVSARRERSERRQQQRERRANEATRGASDARRERREARATRGASEASADSNSGSGAPTNRY
jgi:2,3-bisphosphoglycerate-dependent phosphoglycerate mutase